MVRVTFTLTRCMHRLVTLSGEWLDIEGCLDIVVPDVGLVQFMVVMGSDG